MLKRGADPLAMDNKSVSPISIATDNCQPNIVTILRVAKMNIDLREQDMDYSGDPMFDEVLKDLLSLNTSMDEEHDANDANNDDIDDDKDGANNQRSGQQIAQAEQEDGAAGRGSFELFISRLTQNISRLTSLINFKPRFSSIYIM